MTASGHPQALHLQGPSAGQAGGAGAPPPGESLIRPPIGWAGLAVLLSGYFGLQVATRLLAPGAVEHDEAEQLVLAQVVARGYGLHPPLYTWLQHAFFEVFGVGVLALSLLKHLCLLALYGLCVGAARLVVRDRRLALLAAPALWLVPQLGWEAHRDLSHSILAAALAVAAVWLVLRLARRPGAALHAALGVVLGLGVLSKYSFLVFVAALSAAVLATAEFRRVLVDRRAALALAVAVAVVLPHAVWAVGEGEVLRAATEARLTPGDRSLAGVVAGLGRLASALVRFLGVPVAVAVLCVPGVLRPGGASPAGRLLDRYLAFLLAALVLIVLWSGGAAFKGRWLLPVLALVPLPLLARIEAARVSPRRLRALAGLLVALGGLWLALRIGQVAVGPALGRPTRLHDPYATVAGALHALGFEGGVLLAEETVMAGALRLHFPGSRVLSPDYPALRVPLRGAGPAVALWWPQGRTAAPDRLAALVRERLGGADLLSSPPVLVDLPWPRAPRGTQQIAIVRLPAPAPPAPAAPALR